MFTIRKKGEDSPLDPLLRPIVARACYGATKPADNNSSVLLVGDDEFVLSTGSNLRVYNDVTQSSYLISPQIPNCVAISHMVLSRDKKRLAVIVQESDQDPTGGAGTTVTTMNAITGDKVVEQVHWVKGQTACVHIYDLAAQMAHSPKKPKCIMYTPEKWQDSWPTLRFTSAAISTDNAYIALSTNVPELGTFLYDAVLGALVVKLATTKMIKELSFYPEDSSKLCAIGVGNTISMWRISNNNNAYVSPAHGLANVPHNDFTCLTWLDKGDETDEQRLVVGSSLGYIALIQGIDQIQPVTWAFGAPPGYGVPENKGFKDGAVAQILTRGDIAIAVSDNNIISILEIKKYASGGNGSTAVLIPLRRYELGDVKRITGMCWASLTVTSSFSVCVSTPVAMFYLETEADTLGSKAGIETGVTASGAKAGAALTFVAKKGEYLGGTYSGAQAKPLLGEAPGCDVSWVRMAPSRLMTNFHSGQIDALSLSTRTSMLVTSSASDETLRVVDFSNPAGPCFSVADFSGDRRAETANFTDMHPSGTIFAAACEDEALELIMADTGLETVRRIPTKVPYTLPSGAPFVNMHPVSLVRYSHSGHLLAVVTHKQAQIFNMYHYTVSATDCATQPTLLMALMDHTSPITDICFAHDDKSLYTTAADGTVYSWVLGEQKRHADYVHKGLPATKVCCDDSGFVVAAYCPDLHALKEEARAAALGGLDGANFGSGTGSANASVPGTPFGAVHTSSGRASRRGSIASTPPGSRTSRRGSTASLGGLRGFSAGLLQIGDENTAAIDDGKARIRPQSMLVYWEADALELAHSEAKTLYVDGGILSMCLGRVDSTARDRVCILGLHDGRVLVSLLPFPTHVINAPHMNVTAGMPGGGSVAAAVTNTKQDQRWAQQVEHLPPSHAASPLINKTRRSPGGGTRQMHTSASTGGLLQVESVGSLTDAPGTRKASMDSDDASAHSLGSLQSHSSQPASRGAASAQHPSIALSEAATKQTYIVEEKCKILQLHSSGVTAVSVSISGLWIFTAGQDGTLYMLATSVRARDMSEVPEKSRALENNYVLTDREQLAGIRTRISETDQLIVEKTRESDRIINKLLEENSAKVTELENRMKREMAKRDEIIIKTREDMIRTSKNLNKQIAELKEGHARATSQLESEYEKRLSKENLYLHKMRQAYDEFVLHARMDMQDFEREVEKKKEEESTRHMEDLQQQEKQKEGLLAYIEYVKSRNQEIITALDGAQDEERHRTKIALDEAATKTEEAAQQGRSEIARLTIDVQKAKHAITKKEDDIIRLSSDLGWANERIKKLEMALQESASGLMRQTEVAEKWEFRSGEQTQQIFDLERIRKALTSQLHGLRREVGPEKEKLSQVSDRLTEVDREYELSLQSVSEKESELMRRGGTITQLQKQVRDMRYTTSQKERALSRAAKVLGEYKLALQEAEFDAVKKTVPKSAIAMTLGHGAAAVTAGHMQGHQPGQGGDDDKSINSAVGAAVDTIGNKDSGGIVAGKLGPGRKSGRGGDGGSSSSSETGLVEVIKRSENMNAALRRLEEILLPFEMGAKNIDVDDETTQALVERERHVTQLHQQVNTLRSSLHSTEETALVKVKKSLGDNQVLLEEVNGMRHRIKKLTMENQRQKATIDMLHIRMGVNTGDDGSSAKLGGQLAMASLSGSFVEGGPSPSNPLTSMNRTHSTTVSVPNVKYAGAHAYSRDPNDGAYPRGSQSSDEDLTRGVRGMDGEGSAEITLSKYLLQGQGQGQGQGQNAQSLTDLGAGARNDRPSADVNPLPRDHYQPPYSSGDDGQDRDRDRDRPESEDEAERRRLRAETLAAVNETSVRAKAAIKQNKAELAAQNKRKPVDDELPIENSISSLKTADEKIAAIMAENDKKIKEMRNQSSAQDILTYYQKKLGDVDIPPRSAGGTVPPAEQPQQKQSGSGGGLGRTSRGSAATSRRGTGKARGDTRAGAGAGSGSGSSTRGTGEEKHGGGTGTASVYRPLNGKNAAVVKQGEINATIQLPDIRPAA